MNRVNVRRRNLCLVARASVDDDECVRAGGRVVIVGGGVIGLTAALELLARGRSVTVVEARDGRRGASWANAGWIALELAVPLPRPGLLTTSLRWLSLSPLT